MSVERSPSIRSFKPTGSESGVFTARSFGDVERLVFMQRRALDAQSDTSSQQERKFANLLGGDEHGDDQPQSAGNVGHRLYHLGCEKEKQRQEALRNKRERILMKEMTEITQRPAITARAREKPAKGVLFADHAEEWRRKRDEKLEQKAREAREQEDAEVTGEPLLNAHSLAMLEDAGRYVDPVGGWEQHYAKYCAKHAQPIPKSLFSPNINANAVRADADIPIHDRLYSDSAMRRSKLKEAAEDRIQQELHDPATGRPYFSPQSLRPPLSRPDSMRRTQSDRSIFDQLHDSASKRRDSTVEDVDPEATFTPKINPRSSELAERARKPLYTPGRQSRTTETSPTPSDAQSGKLSPKLSKRNLDDFFRRTERCDHLKQNRLEQARKEMEEREARDCSFQPRINDHSVDLFEAAHVYGKPMSTPTASGVAHLPGDFDQHTAAMVAPATTRKPSSLRESSSALNLRGSGAARAPSGRGFGNQNGTSPSARGNGGGSFGGAPAEDSHPSHSPGGGAGSEDYISAFEKQMFAVLDEWRRLEEV